MLRIREAHIIGYLANGFIGSKNTLFSNIKRFLLNMFQCRKSGFLFQQVTEIIGGKTKYIGTILYRRYAIFRRCIRIKILIQ